ncbi:MAG TPA: hypothetical protein DCG37_02450 [Lachnospiraceae bacterium]|nr:hypothetical protein [Lachnospiraceae bacterium]
MSTTDILFDHAGAEKQAQALEQLSKKMNTLSETDMETILTEINNAWKGDNATAFLQKGDRMQQKLSASAARINDIAVAIRKISANIKKAEEKAAEIASGL